MKRVRDMPDGVRDEDQQKNSNNEGKDQADQDEGMSKLDGGANLGHSSLCPILPDSSVKSHHQMIQAYSP